jgi:aspartate/methionine/tyrosine aminotransferase
MNSPQDEVNMQVSPFKLERYFARYEFNARYLLCSSDCESLFIGDLLALEPGSEEVMRRHWLGYTESPGSPSLRKEIARIYSSIAPDEVLVFSGAEEAIFLFMLAQLKAGDHLIVHWPCYQSLFEIAKGIGADVSLWEARVERDWSLDLDELRQLVRPDTRAVIVNTPHNPTGYLMSRPDFDELNRFTQERGLLLFCDEVYRELEYDPADRLPAASDVNPNAVSLGVMSKSYGLAGLRIGWIATHRVELLQRIAALKDYTTICNSAPSELLSEIALRHRDQLTARNLQLIKNNLLLLDAFFERHANRFQWIRPTAGPIAFPRLLDGDIDSFCDELVQESGVLLLPGTLYDHPGNHFRVGFARRNMPEALVQFEKFITG